MARLPCTASDIIPVIGLGTGQLAMIISVAAGAHRCNRRTMHGRNDARLPRAVILFVVLEALAAREWGGGLGGNNVQKIQLHDLSDTQHNQARRNQAAEVSLDVRPGHMSSSVSEISWVGISRLTEPSPCACQSKR